MRGAGTTLKFLKEDALKITIFTSYKGRDANVAVLDTLDDEVLEVSSLQETGFHRTESEIADRNTIQQFTSGTRIQYTGANWSIALILYLIN